MINLFESIKAHPEYFRQLTCKELLFTQYDCPQQDAMQDLFSQTSYIAYVLSGKRIFHLPGKSIIMDEGKCVFVKKGGWVAEKGPGEGWCVLVFFIPDEYMKNFIKENRKSIPLKDIAQTDIGPVIALNVNEITKSFFTSMLPYFTQEIAPPENLLELKFRELIFNILINPVNSSLVNYLCKLADCNKEPLPEIMEANYTYNLSLSDLARISQRSLASFKREFNEIYNTSPGKWLLEKRLDHAMLLLNTSLKSIGEICFESGFENTTHFSRVFKEKFGLPASQFKKQNISKNIIQS